MIILSSSSDFLQIMQTIIPAIWSLFNSWQLPGVNFSPGILMFGILSFGLAIIFIHGILTITSDGMKHEASMYDRANFYRRNKGSD